MNNEVVDALRGSSECLTSAASATPAQIAKWIEASRLLENEIEYEPETEARAFGLTALD